MRKITLFVCLLVLVLPLFSQNTGDEFVPENYQHNNHLKFNISNLAIRHFYGSYERSINRRLSLQLGAGILSKGHIPYITKIVELPDRSDSDYDIIAAIHDTHLAGKVLNVSARIYIGKGWGQGFYIEPYYRYVKYDVSDYSMDISSYVNNPTTKDPRLNMSGDMKAHSAGVLLGTQWLLGTQKRIVLDVWWIGVHYGKGKGDVTGNTNELLTDEELAHLQKNFDNSVIENRYIEVDAVIRTDGADLSLDNAWAGFRCGVSLGYKF